MNVQKEIEDALQSLDPLYLEVLNESDQHAGPPNRETHFRVVIASAQFDGVNRIKRHRMVQAPLKSLFARGLHALAIETQSSEEFAASQGPTVVSPPCQGGGR